jgi:hypothetical protein
MQQIRRPLVAGRDVPKSNVFTAHSGDNIIGYDDWCGTWKQLRKAFAVDLHVPYFNHTTGGETCRASTGSLALPPKHRNEGSARIERSRNEFPIVGQS